MALRVNAGSGVGGCLLTIVLFVAGILVAMTLGALGVGAADAWFLDGNFTDGWHAAWNKPLVLIGWTVLFYGIVGSLVRSTD